MANGNGNKMYKIDSSKALPSFGSKPGAGKGNTGQRSANDVFKVSPGAAVPPRRPPKSIDSKAPGSANKVYTPKSVISGPKK
jgi:hypothetical protein